MIALVVLSATLTVAQAGYLSGGYADVDGYSGLGLGGLGQGLAPAALNYAAAPLPHLGLGSPYHATPAYAAAPAYHGHGADYFVSTLALLAPLRTWRAEASTSLNNCLAEFLAIFFSF